MNLSKNYFLNFITGCSLAVLMLASGAASAAEADVAAALAHPDRPNEDAAADAARKPAQVLAFAGLQTGMDILELEAGGGYYTEILSRAVGANGSVILQHAPGLMGFVGDGIDIRTANNRLPNVTVSITDFDALDAADNSIDMVTWILGPHELGFAPDDRIEESLVTKRATDAGLTMVGTSNILKNPADPLDVSVFSPTIRGQSSQFIVLYRK